MMMIMMMMMMTMMMMMIITMISVAHRAPSSLSLSLTHHTHKLIMPALNVGPLSLRSGQRANDCPNNKTVFDVSDGDRQQK